MKRRRFILEAGGVLVAASTGAVVETPHAIAQPKVQWRMSTAWPPQLDNLQGSAERLAQIVEETSGGRFRIEVHPGGRIMPPLACFDAAAQGTIEAYMAAGTYWAAKEPAIEWFVAIPFAMDPAGMAAWYSQGDGLKLWEETYAAFSLVPRPGPAFAPQMGGWFRKKIATIADYKGLRMRIGNDLARQIVARAGATAVLTPAADIYAALERGVIDAAEWVGPHDDMKLGLHRTARYYYYPAGTSPGPRASSASTRRRTTRSRSTSGGRSTTPRRRSRSTALRTSTRRRRSRSSDSGPSSRARSRWSSSRRRSCATSGGSRPR